MPANVNPIYTITPNNGFGFITAADTSMLGTSAGVVLIMTCGANGSFLNRLILQPISTSGSTTTSAAAARVYLNNGSTVGTAANNCLFRELSLSAITVNATATVASVSYDLPINFQLPPGYKIYVGMTAIAANTQWNVQAVGGDY